MDADGRPHDFADDAVNNIEIIARVRAPAVERAS